MNILIHLDKDGSVAKDAAKAYSSLWYAVTALYSDGRVILKMSSTKQPSPNAVKSRWPYPDLPDSAFQIGIANPEKLCAMLLGA